MKTKIIACLLLGFIAAAAHAQIGAAPAHDARIEALLDKAGWKYEIDSDGDFRILHRFDDDRTHLAWINSRTEHYRNLEIREIWALGYHSDRELPGDLSRTLLQKNHEYKWGSWKIQRFDGREAAVFYVQIAADADQQSLVAALLSVMGAADELEEELTDADDL